MQRFAVAVSAMSAIAVTLLAPAPSATASSQTELADWLSRAAPHVETIHRAEGDAYAVIAARGRIDDDKLKQSCGSLHDANEALREVMPTPNPNLTAEVQQAIDHFDSASELCTQYFDTNLANRLDGFWSHARTAEQHLSSADSILAGLTPSK